MSGIKGKSGIYKRKPEHGKKISLAKKGHLTTNKTREKIRISRTGQNRVKPYTESEKLLMKKARRAVNNAIRDGRFKRGKCHCGSLGEAHHEDYKKPFEVVWLCRLHHEQHHRSELLK